MDAIWVFLALIWILMFAFGIWMIVKFFTLCKEVKSLISDNKTTREYLMMIQQQIENLDKQIKEWESN